MGCSGGSIFIISHFARLESASLERLIGQLSFYQCKIVVVVNDTNKLGPSPEVFGDGSVCWVRRENTGMNIGAWRVGYELFPDFEYYHFLQSECWVKSVSYLGRYVEMLSPRSGIGLLGESLNSTYDLPPSEIAKRSIIDNRAFFEKDNYTFDRHCKTKVYERIELYKFFHSRWGFDSARGSWQHLRSLNWSTRGDVLKRLNFPVGRSKHECIAAEIVVSLMIVNLGFRVEQSGSSEFSYLGHPDYS